MLVRSIVICSAAAITNLSAIPIAYASPICGPAQTDKLLSPDPTAQDAFGISVSIDGDTAAVGTPYDDIASPNAGAVWLFDREPGGVWMPLLRLTASDADQDAGFSAVSVSSDFVLVGAHQQDSGAPYHSGAAYIFGKDFGGPDQWGEVEKLTASDASVEQHFGIFVALSGDIALVGAPGGHSYAGSGAAYVFERDFGGPDNWGERIKLTAPQGFTEHAFGWSVALDGDVAVVCDFQAEAPELEAGACYVFHRNQNGLDAWGYVKTLTASDGSENDWFGHSVGVSGELIVVGAVAAYEWPPNPGAAYIYERNEGGPDNWGEVSKLVASDAGTIPEFGRGVAIDGNLVIVGATRDNSATDGAAYLFHRNHAGIDGWAEVAKLQGVDAAVGDKFGSYVAISGHTALVGAPLHDQAGVDAGAVYEFTVPPDADEDGITDECDNCPITSNPNQVDADSDGWGDACDSCFGHDDNLDCNSNGVPDGCDPDFDGDGLIDDCDPDIDDDGVDNGPDVCDFTPIMLPPNLIEPDGSVLGDLDGDCDVDLIDYAIMQERFTGPNPIP